MYEVNTEGLKQRINREHKESSCTPNDLAKMQKC
jgi:hypothetical protein